jgi:hypothetical protein
MKTFLIRNGDNYLIEISDLDKLKVVVRDNGITDFFDGAIYTWYLLAYEKDGRFHIVAEAHESQILEDLRIAILTAYRNGESEVSFDLKS